MQKFFMNWLPERRSKQRALPWHFLTVGLDSCMWIWWVGSRPDLDEETFQGCGELSQDSGSRVLLR
jgi:hypothetical protein